MEVLKYDISTGLFYWRVHRSKGIREGGLAGHADHRGYTRISIDNKKYLAHRLAWYYMCGEWPDSDLDHIDGDKTNNRVENLRRCTKAQNSYNASYAKGSTGIKGVRVKPSGSYDVRVSSKYLGSYKDLELAEFVAMEARESMHGEFARHI